jgi:Uma2 family endonuclease
MATTAATARKLRGREDSALWTYEDLLEIPDDRFRYEIIDGDLVVTPSPLSVHQIVSRNLFRILDAHVHAKDRGDVIYAPLDVIFDDLNVLEPDILFVSKARRGIIGRRGIAGPPDLAVEVLSKGTRRRDLVVKREVCRRFRVPHYWTLDPFERVLREHVLRGRGYREREVHGARRFRPALFRSLTIDLGRVWA